MPPRPIKRWLARVPFPFGNPTTEATANCASKVTSVEKGSFSGTLPGRKSLFGPFPVAAPAERPDHRLISKTPSGPQIEGTCCCGLVGSASEFSRPAEEPVVRPLRGAATGKKRSKKYAPWKGAGESAAIPFTSSGRFEIFSLIIGAGTRDNSD